MKHYYSARSVARVLGVSVKTVRRITACLNLIPFHMGRCHIWVPADIDRMRKHLA